MCFLMFFTFKTFMAKISILNNLSFMYLRNGLVGDFFFSPVILVGYDLFQQNRLVFSVGLVHFLS